MATGFAAVARPCGADARILAPTTRCTTASSWLAVRCCFDDRPRCESICPRAKNPTIPVHGNRGHAATHAEAAEICAAAPGRRLCNTTELLGGGCCKTGCTMDRLLVWSSEACADARPAPGPVPRPIDVDDRVASLPAQGRCCRRVGGARWSRGALLSPPGCELCQLRDAANCLRGKRVLFVGDSVTRYIFWSVVFLLCERLGCDAQQLPPRGIFFWKCVNALEVRLPGAIRLEYHVAHYGADLAPLIRRADAVYYNSGIWMVADKKRDADYLAEYGRAFGAAAAHPSTAFVVAETTVAGPANGIDRTNKTHRANALLRRAYLDFFAAEHASVTDGRVVILPLGFEVFSLDHLLSDHGHPSYGATGQIAQLAMRAVCSAVMRGRSADAVPLNRTTNVGAPQMPTDGDRSRWCAAGGTKRVVRVGASMHRSE